MAFFGFVWYVCSSEKRIFFTLQFISNKEQRNKSNKTQTARKIDGGWGDDHRRKVYGANTHFSKKNFKNSKIEKKIKNLDIWKNIFTFVACFSWLLDFRFNYFGLLSL